MNKVGRYKSYPEHSETKTSRGMRIPLGWVEKKLKWEISAKSGVDGKEEHGRFVLYGANGPIGMSNSASITGKSVLVGRVGSAGAVTYVDGEFGVSDNALIIENHCSRITRFDFYTLSTLNLEEDVSKNAQPLITGSSVRDRKVVAPRSDMERLAIANFLDHETAKIDTLIEKQQQLIKLLKEKRQAVISHAVTKGLNPAAPMKDSGVEWLGEVPEHWKVSELRFERKPGTSITYGIVQAGPHVDDGIPYIKTSDMSGESLPIEGYSRTSAEIDESYSRSKVYEGDLVISIRASVGKCHILPKALNGANLTQGTAKISPGKELDRDFLYSFMNSTQVQLYLDSIAKGATFKEITLDMLRRTAVPVPPMSEQKAIASLIKGKSVHFDQLIFLAEKAVSLMQERRTALICAAVTGKIDVRNWQPSQNEISMEASV